MATRVPIESVKPNPKNPRTHPPKQLEALAEAIRKFGQVRPILVRKANRMIVAGHGVWQACNQAGLGEIDIELWDVDQRTADLFMIGDNRIAELGVTDNEKVRDLVRDLDPDNYLALGYSAADAEKLLASASRQAIDEIQIVNAGDVEDVFWISIRGPLRDQAATLQALQKATKSLKDVHVEMGTRADVLI